MEVLVSPDFWYGTREHRKFQENGYVVFPRFLSERGLKILREKFKDIYDKKDATVDGEWIINLHQILPQKDNWIWSIAANEQVVGMLEKMLDCEIELYASQLHRKEPYGGHNVPWHQDGDDQVRTLWITLDDVDRDNGGLVLLPGLHKAGRLPFQPVGNEEELESAEYFARHNVFRVQLPPQSSRRLRTSNKSHDPAHRCLTAASGATALSKRAEQHVAIKNEEAAEERRGAAWYLMPAGAAAVHHPFTPHRSGPNCTPRDRRVLILRFAARRSDAGQGRERAGGGGALPHFADPRRGFLRAVLPVRAAAPPPPPAPLLALLGGAEGGGQAEGGGRQRKRRRG